jgi:hypothetical protein
MHVFIVARQLEPVFFFYLRKHSLGYARKEKNGELPFPGTLATLR